MQGRALAMMRLRGRRRLLIRCISAAVLLAVMFLVLRVREENYPGIATFQQVREGMSWLEVEQTVGGPPGYYSDAGKRIGFAAKPAEDRLPGPKRHIAWYCDDGYMKIQLDDVARVKIVVVVDQSAYRQSFIRRFLRRLGL